MTAFRGRADLGDIADAEEGILFVFQGGTIEEMTDAFDDTYDGRGGNDTILAGQTNDTVLGGSGDDQLNGGAGQDWVYGGTGNDTITSDNTVFSTFDQLFGGMGDDVMFGGDGAEVFEGGRGVDSIYGGTNVDVIRILDGDEIDYIDAGGALIDGLDTLELSFITSRGMFVDLASQTYRLVGGPSQTILNVEAISGTQRSDTMIGTEAQETFVGQNGGDSLVGGGGRDYLDGVRGVDRLYGEAGFDSLFGGSGKDFLYGGTSNDFLSGGSGDDQIYGGTGNDFLAGVAGNDTLNASAGDDTLLGEEGNDILNASEGRDVVDGGEGSDTLTGGADDDHFVFSTVLNGRTNVDTLTDFTQGVDAIILFDGTGTSFAALGATVDEGELRMGNRARDADDRLIYDAETGNLYLDVDGEGGVGRVLFAVLANKPVQLDIGDFMIAG